MPAATESPGRLGHPSAGFSLTELLLAAVLSGVTIVVAVQVLSPQLRSNQRMEGTMRLQERWARVSYLLDTEIAKARSINTTTNSLSLQVPVRTATGSTERTITYRQSGTQLLRDGPAINTWGDLNTSSTLNGELLLDGVSAGSFMPIHVNSTVSYSLNLTDPNSDATYSGRGSVSRGRADCLSFESDNDTSCQN